MTPARRLEVSSAFAWLTWSLTALHLVVVLGLGAVFISMDWSAIACFDGDEPACLDPDLGRHGLGLVHPSSWVIAALAVLITAVALRVTWRMRQPQELIAVVICCALSVTAIQVLGHRL